MFSSRFRSIKKREVNKHCFLKHGAKKKILKTFEQPQTIAVFGNPTVQIDVY